VDDAELAASARAAAIGDQGAFAAIVRMTQPDVIRACAALVDRGSADDLAQETYLRVFRALPAYQADASLRTWILGIARHVCIDEVRRRTRRRAMLRLLPPRPASVQPSDATELEMLVRSLPDEQREAFVLTQVVGLTYDETAQVCSCPIGTVRSRVARARASLVASIDAAARPAI
jgi:RNA polymerase sigma-70 factor (ECF subfamily)